jgi:hypothetical protein
MLINICLNVVDSIGSKTNNRHHESGEKNSMLPSLKCIISIPAREWCKLIIAISNMQMFDLMICDKVDDETINDKTQTSLITIVSNKDNEKCGSLFCIQSRSS